MPIYNSFIQNKKYGQELQDCISSTVSLLINKQTKVNNPGMLLGKIQSGKTKTFIGIIALAFDRGYDICIVFTKGTKLLAEQTLQRLDKEFREYIDNDEVKLYNVMRLPVKLTPYMKRQKLILVVKKETHNLDRLVDFYNDYPDLVKKKTLIIDDEADFASVGFKRNATVEDGVSMNVLAQKINSIRDGFNDYYNFLQVTATPYSLYLQPRGEFELNSFTFQPVRPAFTTLVPIHDAYIGGKQYFEDSQDSESVFSHLQVQVPDMELAVLWKRDARYISNIFSTPNLQIFRQAIVSYLVGGSIRIIQNKVEGRNYKSSFIIHTSTTQERHHWQIELAEALLRQLTKLASVNDTQLKEIIKQSYETFIDPIKKNNDIIPNFNSVFSKVNETLLNGDVGVLKINSENEIATLIDRNGQLRLDSPFNIFIGGQILDRGITVENLIGFFYGRNPNIFQQDTVLQHSRMYGARSMKDMAVTRLYTSNRIYRAMLTMHTFDSALRDAFERGIHHGDDSVIFIERDNTGNIRPCAPSKILITSTETIRPHSRYLPIGFQTKPKTTIQKTITEIDQLLKAASKEIIDRPFLLPLASALKIVDLIATTYEYNKSYNNLGYEWDYETLKAIIRRLVDDIGTENLKGYIYCYVRTNRNVSRMKNQHTAFSDSPDSGSGETALTIARNIAAELPCLIMLKQNGIQSNGWRDAEFWWPILVTPANTRTAVFASETIR